MAGIVLSVNAGSSSLKVSLFAPTFEGPKHLATCTVDAINTDQPSFTSSVKDINDEEKNVRRVKDHDEALRYILNHLFRTTTSAEDLTHVCHRVVHGGDYQKRQPINEDSLHHLESLIELAPLHNKSSTALIRATLKQLPNATSIAYFDTTFHRSLPRHIYTLPLDRKLADQCSLRKYGFHGISYSFILRNVAEFLQKPESDMNLIIMHLGSGASICCVQNGKSLDTSMGLTPLAGLPGATRSGDIDPTTILHYIRISHASVDTAEEVLNKQSGWKALTGTTSFGDVAKRSNDETKLAFDLFVDRILNFVGAYYLKLGGQVDALVFAGGIGEKSAELREAVSNQCQCLGFVFDKDRNQRPEGKAPVKALCNMERQGGEGDRKKRVLVCETDEQFEIDRKSVV